MVQAKGGRVIEAARLHQNYYRSQVEMLAPGKAELLQFWFPGWQASVHGTPVQTGPSGSQAIVSAGIGACAVVFLRQRRYKYEAVRNR
jgi:hypothetical protein